MKNEIKIFDWIGECLEGDHEILVRIKSFKNYHKIGDILKDNNCETCKCQANIRLKKLNNGEV